MFKKIYFNPKLPFPHFSFALIASCLVVSIPILFNRRLYFFLGGNYSLIFPWQIFVSRFAHGPPLLNHLAGNILVIVSFGVLVEKILGSWRILVLSFFALGAELVVHYWSHSFGNGISGIAWSFGPFAFAVILMEFKKDGLRCLREPFMVFVVMLLGSIWILVTFYVAHVSGWFALTNIFHAVATGVGIFWLLVWREEFVSNTHDILVGDLTSKAFCPGCERFGIVVGYAVLLFNIIIVCWVLFVAAF